jgi:hypothetical protein
MLLKKTKINLKMMVLNKNMRKRFRNTSVDGLIERSTPGSKKLQIN